MITLESHTQGSIRIVIFVVFVAVAAAVVVVVVVVVVNVVVVALNVVTGHIMLSCGQ